jgi:putative transposase
LRTFSVLFAIEIESRRVWVLGVTRNPNATGVTEKARNLSFDLAEAGRSFRFALRDRDCKYTSSFDQVFSSEGIRVMRTPIQAPKANAFAECWVRSVRNECLDGTLIWGRRHLEKVLAEYVGHDNRKRPHRGLSLRVPHGEGSLSCSPRPRQYDGETSLAG